MGFFAQMGETEMSSTHNWLTVREVASELQVHEETVRRWIRAGELPAIELGGPRTMYRIRPADLGAFMRQHSRTASIKPTPPPKARTPTDFQQIVERLPIITFVFDPRRSSGRGSLLFISSEVEQLLGVPTEEWYQNIDGVWPTLMSREQFDLLSGLASQMRASQDHFSIDIRMTNRETGKPVWVSLDMEVNRPEPTGQELWYGLLVDITDRKLTEERLRGHSIALKQLGAKLVEDLTMDGMILELFSLLPEALEAKLARLHLISAGRRNLTTYSHLWNGRAEIDLDELKNEHLQIETDSLAPHVLQTEESIRITDLLHDDRLESSQELRDIGARSALGVPVRGQNRIIAIIEVFSEVAEAYRPSDRTFLEGAGNILALAFARQEDRWKSVPEVAEMLGVQMETVRRWIRSGSLVAAMPGGAKAGYRIEPTQLDAFLMRRRTAK
jgi:excisionase family DNA binding protein